MRKQYTKMAQQVLDFAQKESKKLKNKFSALYNDKIDGIITTSEFTLLKEEYQKEMQNFNLHFLSVVSR